jgi:DnaK suppressor protein
MMIDRTIQEDLKKSLLAEKSKLEEELGLIANKDADDAGDYETKFEDLGRDDEDNAEEVEEYSNKIGITETLEKKLKEVNDALTRIDNDTYGICENCQDEEIPIDRLRAYPAAKTCLKCQK